MPIYVFSIRISALVIMAVMRIWKMFVFMGQFIMLVWMMMLLAHKNREIVLMLVVAIMGMRMIMLNSFVLVFMLVLFCQMKPNA